MIATRKQAAERIRTMVLLAKWRADREGISDVESKPS